MDSWLLYSFLLILLKYCINLAVKITPFIFSISRCQKSGYSTVQLVAVLLDLLDRKQGIYRDEFLAVTLRFTQTGGDIQLPVITGWSLLVGCQLGITFCFWIYNTHSVCNLTLLSFSDCYKNYVNHREVWIRAILPTTS